LKDIIKLIFKNNAKIFFGKINLYIIKIIEAYKLGKSLNININVNKVLLSELVKF